MIKHLIRAFAPIAYDSLGVLAFAALIALHVNLTVVTAIGVAISIAVIVWEYFSRGKVPALQWVSLALVFASAAATLFTGDARFLMVKPTVIYLAIGAAMLQRGWMVRYVAPDRQALVADLMTTFGYVWAGLMFVTGILNLIVAIWFSAWWPAFIAVFPMVTKIALFAVQFSFVYASGRARARRDREAAEAAPLNA